MLMLRHGVWIPQEVARTAGGGELLPVRAGAHAGAGCRVRGWVSGTLALRASRSWATQVGGGVVTRRLQQAPLITSARPRSQLTPNRLDP